MLPLLSHWLDAPSARKSALSLSRCRFLPSRRLPSPSSHPSLFGHKAPLVPLDSSRGIEPRPASLRRHALLPVSLHCHVLRAGVCINNTDQTRAFSVDSGLNQVCLSVSASSLCLLSPNFFLCFHPISGKYQGKMNIRQPILHTALDALPPSCGVGDLHLQRVSLEETQPGLSGQPLSPGSA